ncbi:hypothetical protein K493DRAFT_327599 [Basidiobolus meristosporus CBS 931.73]|uniref:Uncharacterized protein n=1 Tax=Basidiobolus meristosporus CBS 931.73 TaxID=1314790 RepID=A0A1Y1VQ81_9FUNG|nr:hypothetical protein K493DRAFT_327599 [Basidiobolus meristosporus CBS 931.73]|eukprot:ORX63419.1 hypothetical protein K493DRAFT_327599 [Basidiobolus meristosporus CBS 931.73]
MDLNRHSSQRHANHTFQGDGCTLMPRANQLVTVVRQYYGFSNSSHQVVTAEEQPILHSLVSIRNRLGVLKKDRSNYHKVVDVVAIYDEQCLDSMDAFGVYSQEDIAVFSSRLQGIEEIIRQGQILDDECLDPKMGLAILVSKKLNQCQNLLRSLRNSLKNMDVELIPIHKRLSARGSYDLDRVREIQGELRDIDGSREYGKFVDKDGSIATSQAQVIGLLERCYEMTHDIYTSNKIIAEPLKPIYERLEEMKTQLQKLVVTQRWTLRKTDLWSYQIRLNEIDAIRADVYFYAGKNGIPEGQAVLNYLLQKCYRLVYHLLSSSEPIAEPLILIHNQLVTSRACLLEVKRWEGPLTAHELNPYQLKLASIDNLRVDGRFLDEDNNVPEDQAIVMSLLNECYDIIYELKASMDD